MPIDLVTGIITLDPISVLIGAGIGMIILIFILAGSYIYKVTKAGGFVAYYQERADYYQKKANETYLARENYKGDFVARKKEDTRKKEARS